MCTQFIPHQVHKPWLSFVIELLHDQMQEKVNIDSHLSVKEVHELRVVELSLQQVVQRYLCVGAGNHHDTAAPVNGEYTNFVT